ncbi:hypothetical protein GQ600_18355 [Phytophthora cactorum]|nr:hypothetical protein GQ600_18355 [Phytophthora cactorum]
MSTLLHDWDEGSKSKRKKLLEWFCGRFDLTLDGGGLLESEYGADIALFLPRLLSWMQKTTASAICSTNDTCSATSKPAKVKCFALAEQVACLHVFFGAANAHEYYREFQHADGLQLVLKIVAIQGNAPTLKNLWYLSPTEKPCFMSRQCKEEISCLDGELAVIHGVLASGKIGDWKSESRVWTLCREILLEQLVGNPNGLDRAHEAIAFMLRHSDVCLQLFGAQVLRELISDNSFSFDPEYRRQKEYDLVPLCLSLLDSTDVCPLAYARLVCNLTDRWCDRRLFLRSSFACKVEERFALIEDTTEHETYAHLRSAFTLASQAVNTLMNSNRNLLPIMARRTHQVDRCGLLTPLAFVLVIERPHSLKWQAAAISIQFIISHHYRGAAALIGELFEVPVDDLLEWRDKRGDDGTMLAGFLLGDEAHRSRLALRSYQHRWYRPLSPRKQSDTDCVLNDIEQSVETAARDYVPELQVQTRVGGAPKRPRKWRSWRRSEIITCASSYRSISLSFVTSTPVT